MHGSLWILIGSNGILSLPQMSVRMQPPPFRLEITRLPSLCVCPCVCLEHLVRRSLSAVWEWSKPYVLWFLSLQYGSTEYYQPSDSSLNCHDSVRSRCLAFVRDVVGKQEFWTCQRVQQKFLHYFSVTKLLGRYALDSTQIDRKTAKRVT